MLDWVADVETLLGILQQVAPEVPSETLSKLFSRDSQKTYLRLQDMTVFNRCVNGVNLLRKWSTLIEQVNGQKHLFSFSFCFCLFFCF